MLAGCINCGFRSGTGRLGGLANLLGGGRGLLLGRAEILFGGRFALQARGQRIGERSSRFRDDLNAGPCVGDNLIDRLLKQIELGLCRALDIALATARFESVDDSLVTLLQLVEFVLCESLNAFVDNFVRADHRLDGDPAYVFHLGLQLGELLLGGHGVPDPFGGRCRAWSVGAVKIPVKIGN